MNKYIGLMASGAIVLLIGLSGCGSGPDPADEVRTFRRQYQIEYDFTVSQLKGELGLEIRVQNLAGTLKLHDLTVDIIAYDAEEVEFWRKRTSLDVSTIGHRSTKAFEFFEKIDHADTLDALSIILAPDHEGTDYKTYKEFIRIGTP